MTNNLYLDIHVLQTVPSSNINRDDTGTPKTAIYGGVTRSRVSSQSWKRAVRLAFKEQTKNAKWLESYRTLRVVELLAQKLVKLGNLDEEDALKKADEVIKGVGIKTKKDKKTGQINTGALLLVSDGELEKLAKFALENDEINKDSKKQIKQILLSDQSLDLALFGRMVADDPELNVDAASQVAHAVSTHEIVPEFDFYTAVDDARNTDNAGSAMLGSIEYNSSTLYRYANVNVNELMHNLGNRDLTIEGIKLFIKDFLLTMPTGKENTFANKTLPQYILINLRDDTPVNLVTAFENPVQAKGGYMEASIDKLEETNKNISKMADESMYSIVLTTKSSNLDNQAENVADLTQKVTEKIAQELNDEDNND